LSIPVDLLPHVITRNELNGWMSYFTYKEADVHEVQMGILISTVVNAMNSKSKATPDKFIFSGKNKPKPKDDGIIRLSGYMPIKEDELEPFFRPFNKKKQS